MKPETLDISLKFTTYFWLKKMGFHDFFQSFFSTVWIGVKI